MHVIDAALICARQSIALRTLRDNLDDPFVRDSNFKRVCWYRWYFEKSPWKITNQNVQNKQNMQNMIKYTK